MERGGGKGGGQREWEGGNEGGGEAGGKARGGGGVGLKRAKSKSRLNAASIHVKLRNAETMRFSACSEVALSEVEGYARLDSTSQAPLTSHGRGNRKNSIFPPLLVDC